MSIVDLLDAVTSELRAAGIPFMLTGSFAAAVHGAGRATMDVDLVIDPAVSALDSFVQRMSDAGRYVSAEAAREALAARTMFNLIDVESGWKVDLIIRKDRAFSRSEFDRREHLAFGPVTLPVASVEDLVLAKLEWARLGGSARQLEDVRALVRIAGPELDRAYLTQWIAELGVAELWRAVSIQDVA